MKSKANAVTWGIFDQKTHRYVRHVKGGRNKRIFKTRAGAEKAALLLNKAEGARKRFFVVAHGQMQEKRAAWGGRTGRVVAGNRKKDGAGANNRLARVLRLGKVVKTSRIDAIADLLSSCQTQVNRMEAKLAPFDLETMANTMKEIMLQLAQHGLAIGRLVNPPEYASILRRLRDLENQNHKEPPEVFKPATKTMWLNVRVEHGVPKSTFYATKDSAESAASTYAKDNLYIIIAKRVEIPA